METEVSAANQDLFGRVDTKRISQTIADRIRDLIRSGQLVVGDRLPPERDLCESFEVSRVALREALRLLEANGWVHIKVGAGGGAIITAPTAGRVGEGISDLIAMSTLAADDVTEARRIFELGMIPLVCERATEQELSDLMAHCDAVAVAREQGSYDVPVSFEFHLKVARATHNPAIVILLDSFKDPILMSLREARHSGLKGIDEHRAFVEAVMKRNVAEATRIMSEHLHRTAVRLAKS